VYARPIELSEQTVDLSQFLKQSAKALKIDPDFPANVKFNLHIPDELILVPIDPDAFRRALLNLLINGIQAMPEGGELTLALLKYETNCQISISDTGIGMDEEQLKALFSPLFTTKKNGNGLGLVETKKIIQGHGGSIDARSILGRGTTFLLTLPLKRIQ
jgi:signal transduction histidine kinase